MVHHFPCGEWKILQNFKKSQNIMKKIANTYAITAVNIGDRPSATISIAALKKTSERKEETY